MQQLKPLWSELGADQGDPGGIPARPIETGDMTHSDGIGRGSEDDRNDLGGRDRRPGGDVAAAGQDDRDLAADEIGRQCRQPIVLTLGPAIFDGQVAALDEARVAQAPVESRHIPRPIRRRHAVKRANHRHRWLLCSCRERPCHCRTAEQRDELAPFHSITSSALASSACGTVRPSAFAVLRLMTSSYLVGACTGKSAGFSPFRMRST